VQTTYQVNTDELDERLVTSIKAAFPGKRVTIAIHDEPDETDYLLSNPERRARLLRAIEDIRAGRNLVAADQSLFQ
jgi:hypothetical protein